MTCQVFLSAKAQRDLDGFPDKITNQILADCTRLADNPIPDGKRIKKLQGFREALYRLRAGDYRVVSSDPALASTSCVSSASRTFTRAIDLPGISEDASPCLAIQRRACTGCRARRGPRDGVAESGNQALPRYFLQLLQSVKSSNDPCDATPV